jgi:SMI1 / KNR4 family (SUKH-1)
MAGYAWRELLTRWSRELLDCPEIAAALPPGVVQSGWLGYPPASETQITLAEERLHTRLPPSYREFLQVTNGWRQAGLFIERIWSVEDVDWYAARHQDLIDAWRTGEVYYPDVRPPSDAEYLVYGAAQDPTSLLSEYLQTALEISDIGDAAVYLLNPKIVAPDGDWEAWFHATWLPGARRYRSFYEMIQAERELFLQVKDQR